MSSPSKKATNTISEEVIVPHQQQAIEDTHTIGSNTTRDALRMRKPNKNKKKRKKKKKRVAINMFFYDSDKGSEEQVPDWEDFAVGKGYYSDLDKLI